MGRFDKHLYETPEKETAPERAPEAVPAPTGGRFQKHLTGPPSDAPKPVELNKPFGELRNPDPQSYTDWLRSKAQDALIGLGAKPHVARHLGGAAVDLGSLTPAGTVLSAADLTHNVKQGNIGAAVVDALGALPGVSYARRAIRGTPTVIPAHTAPFRETERAAPPIGGFVTPLPSEARDTARAGYRAIEQAPIVYHPGSMSDATDVARNVLPNPRFGPVFTPETAPNTHAMLERFGLAFPRGGPRPVNAYDFDALRQQLKSQTGAEGAAGRQAAEIIETYMLNPPKGGVLQGENLLPALRQTYADTRGNWRGYKTADAVVDAADAARIGAAGEHSGKNLGNRTRQSFQQYVKTPAGEARLFGATPAQLDKIEDVAAGDTVTNWLRSGSNRLGGGGGFGQTHVSTMGAAGGGALGALLGGPWGAALGVPIGYVAPGMIGGAMRKAANTRTARAAQEVSEDIMRSTPLYRERAALPMNAPVEDARVRARDAIATAMLSSGPSRDYLKDLWEGMHVPYKNR